MKKKYLFIGGGCANQEWIDSDGREWFEFDVTELHPVSSMMSDIDDIPEYTATRQVYRLMGNIYRYKGFRFV